MGRPDDLRLLLLHQRHRHIILQKYDITVTATVDTFLVVVVGITIVIVFVVLRFAAFLALWGRRTKFEFFPFSFIVERTFPRHEHETHRF